MKNFTITYSFYLVLKSKRVKVDEVEIKGNSVMDCSRKAFDKKLEIQRRKGGEIIYKKDKVVKEKKVRKKKDNIDLNVKSKDLSANDAIEYIKNHELDVLVNGQFLSEDEDRVTVTNAFESKQKQNKEQ